MSFDSNLHLLNSALKKLSGDKLFKLLQSISGPKDLILDKNLISSLDYIASFSQLKVSGVERVYKLEPGTTPGVTGRCVYLITPNIHNTKLVCDHVNACQSMGNKKMFWIIFIPRKLDVCEVVLEREGVHGHVSQTQLQVGFFPIERDFFSLEIPHFYRDFFLKGDVRSVHTAAMSLVEVCRLCGNVPKVFGQGRCAKMVVDLMIQILKKTKCDSPVCGKIPQLLIVDRDIDYVSVLLSQLTYEGILDEVFGFNSGRITFPKQVTGKDEPLKVALNSTDSVYDEIRNSYFPSVFATLSEKAKHLQAKSETSGMTLGDIKNFVTKEMKNVKQEQASLSLHIGACEVILKKKHRDHFQERLQIERDIIENQNVKECIDYIEDVINREDPFTSALRLLCLLSISQEGLSTNDYKELVTQFRQSYGCQFITTLHKLKKLGLLVDQTSSHPPSLTKSKKLAEMATAKASQIAEKMATAVAFSKYNSFQAITKKFNLIPSEEDPDLKNPQSMSYVYGGAYVPLVARMAEQIVVNGSLNNVEESLKLLPGPIVTHFEAEKGHVEPVRDFNSKTVLVFVLGGITFAEVAALRLLGKMNGCQILIATTSVISGESLMKMLAPDTH